MSALEKQFRACVKFLNGVRSLPQYENVERKQLQGLVTAVGKVAPLSAAQASTLLEWVDAGNFKTDMAEQLRTAIANKTTAAEESRRRPCQDFTLLPLYLTKELWDLVMDQSSDRAFVLQCLCEHGTRLSLRCPTEGTMAVLVALAYRPQLFSMSKKDKHTLLLSKKNMLKKACGNTVPGAIYLEALPSVTSELPEDLRGQAFPDTGQPHIAPIPAQDILSMAASIPLRSSHGELICEPPQLSSSEQMPGAVMGEMVQGVMTACFRAMASTSSGGSQSVSSAPLAICDIPRAPAALHASLPSNRLAQTGSTSAGNTQEKSGEARRMATSAEMCPARQQPEEIPDGVDDVTSDSQLEGRQVTDVHQKNTALQQLDSNLVHKQQQASNRGTKDAAKVNPRGDLDSKLQALRTDMREKGTRGQAKAQVMRKPSACMRKPAAPGKTMKRPASCMAPADTSETREARRQRLLKIIPDSLKRQYKHGCVKCRHRELCTPSCWRDRGFALDD